MKGKGKKIPGIRNGCRSPSGGWKIEGGPWGWRWWEGSKGCGGLGRGALLMASLKARRESVFYWTLSDLLPSNSLKEIKAKVLEKEAQWLMNLSKGLIFPLFSRRSIGVKFPAIYHIETHPDCTQPAQQGQVARKRAILWDLTSVYRWPTPSWPNPSTSKPPRNTSISANSFLNLYFTVQTSMDNILFKVVRFQAMYSMSTYIFLNCEECSLTAHIPLVLWWHRFHNVP